MLGSLVFLTPSAGLVVLAAAIPLAVLGLVAQRERAGRKLLGLTPPPPASQILRIVALVAVPALLGLAAAQPALRSTTNERVRTDAQAYFVIDISRSMLARHAPGDPSRLVRAKRVALALREALPGVPSGIATLTDRLLPDLLPHPDAGVFANTLDQAVAIEQPTPASSNIKATTYNALANLGTQNFYAGAARHRLAVILTDGESNPVQLGTVAKALATGPGVQTVFVHVWAPNEAVYDGSSREQGYHEDPQSGQLLSSLAGVVGGKAYGESSIGQIEGAMRAAVGSGPTAVQGRTERTQPLAPYVALLALLPLLLIVLRPLPRGLASALVLLGGELFNWAGRIARSARARARGEVAPVT